MFKLFIVVLLSCISVTVNAEFAYDLNLGNWSVPVTTNSSDAQKWFDTAWMQMWGFNHEEAIRCYQKALMYDPNLLMAYVGLSLSYGPNYNNEAGLSSDLAFNFSQLALSLLNQSSTVSSNTYSIEIAIANAVSLRAKKNGTGTFWDPVAYANALRAVYRLYGTNPNIVVELYAESLMLARTSSLWNRDAQGNISPASSDTVEIVNVLEKALEKTPDYPPLCHLYVHIMEQSNDPQKALIHADHLRKTVPDQGHLRHMPSHIDVWVGNYQSAVQANVQAIAMDYKYIAHNNNNTQEYYKYYLLHNHHFLLWACMFTAQKALALQYASDLQNLLANPNEKYTVLGGMEITTADFEQMGFAPWQVLFRFSEWDRILSQPIPSQRDIYPASIATAYLTRALAYASTGRVKEAEAEKMKFEQATQNPMLQGKALQNNLMWNSNTSFAMNSMMNMDVKKECGVLNVGYYVLKGLIEHAKNNVNASVACFNFAIAIEENLRYAEPWGWMLPSRHTLGQVLIAHRMFAQAEQVFRADLDFYQSNLWALYGLHQSLIGQGKSAEAASVKANYSVAAASADIDVNAVFSFNQTQTLVANAASQAAVLAGLTVCSFLVIWF